MSQGGIVGYGRTFPPSFSYVDLGTFSNWHASNASTFVDSYLQSNYNYTYDGGANYILNGDNNMFNVGNILSLSGFVGATSINYGTLSNVSSSTYGYFVSEPNVWPSISLGYVNSGTIRWTNAGTVGESPNLVSTFSGTYSTGAQSRYGSYWAGQQYGTSSPTICYLWFTVQQSNVYSAITASNDGRRTSAAPPANYTQFFSVTGSNLIFGQTLLSVYDATSSQRGYLISKSTVEGFLSNYIQSASIPIY